MSILDKPHLTVLYVCTLSMCNFTDNFRFKHHPAIVPLVRETEEKVMSGVLSPGFAADQLLSLFLNQEQSQYPS